MKNIDKNFKELERLEDKYIIKLTDLSDIESELKKNMKSSYADPKANYVLINTLYLDSPDLDFLKFHSYGIPERIKVRIRKYGANGKWDNENVFLEIKEKSHEDVKKYRLQLDSENFKNVKIGKMLIFNEKLEKLNKPLYTVTDLDRYIEKYNKIVLKYELTPIVSITYKRLAYGKGPLRITLDTDISFISQRTVPLSRALKIKKSMDWKELKEYSEKYKPKENAILEIKHNSSILPLWLTKLLESKELESEKFSKYVYSSSNLIRKMIGE